MAGLWSRASAALGLALLVLDGNAAEHAGTLQPEHRRIGAFGLGAFAGDIAAAEDRDAGVDHPHLWRHRNGHPAEHRERAYGDLPPGQDGLPQVDVGAAEHG